MLGTFFLGLVFSKITIYLTVFNQMHNLLKTKITIHRNSKFRVLHFPSSFGNLYILLAVNYVSKWVEVIPCPRNDGNTMVGFIQRNILSRFGAPRTIISDEGSHFENKFFAKLINRYGIKHMMGLAYHP